MAGHGEQIEKNSKSIIAVAEAQNQFEKRVLADYATTNAVNAAVGQVRADISDFRRDVTDRMDRILFAQTAPQAARQRRAKTA